MALTVTITGGETIEQDDQLTLTATVTDASGNTPPGTLEYRWSASQGSFVGATDEASAVYHADFTETTAVDVTVTCDVTLPANATPTTEAPSLTALAEIGVTGILVNMFLTTLGAVAPNSNSVLYNSSTGTLEAGSDQRLASDIRIYQLRWDNTNNNFVLNNDETGNIGNFFTGNNNQSLYIVFEDGTYIELTPSDFAAGTSRGQSWARWLVSDASILALLNGLDTTDDLVVGVADTGSIGWDADTGSDTETFSATVPPPLSIESIDEQTMPILTEDYELEIDIGGEPDRAYVDGDMEGFYHTWDPDDAKLRIKAIKVTRLIKGAVWNVHIVKGTRTLDSQIIYNVIPAAPVISDPGAQTLYKGIPFALTTTVANVPTVMRGSGLLTGLKYISANDEAGESVIMTEGLLPSNAKLSESSFMMKQYAENDGGSDALDVPVTIKEAAFLGILRDYYSVRLPDDRPAGIRFYDLKNANQRFGSDIKFSGQRWRAIAMSGRRVAVGRLDNALAAAKVFDYFTGEQVGPDFNPGFYRGGSGGLAMNGRYLVAWISAVFKVYDVENGNVQLGDNVAPGGNIAKAAMSGTLVATFQRGAFGGGTIKVYDVSDENQQVGSDITLSSSYRALYYDMAMSGSLVAVVRSDGSNTPAARRQRLVQIFDTSKSNAQVGSDISLDSTGAWRDIAMSGSLVAVLSSGDGNRDAILKVFDTDNNNAQVGSDVNTGGAASRLAMSGSLIAVSNGSIVKVYDASNSLAQVGSDISSAVHADIAMAGS